MRGLQMSTDAAPVAKQLLKRLAHRWGGEQADWDGLEKTIETLSGLQAEAFRELEKQGLVKAALEMFVSGALRDGNPVVAAPESSPLAPKKPAHLSERSALAPESTTDIGRYEPDGPVFFSWAEFGLQAARMGFDTELWLRVLPILLRAERIFALVYGEPEDGVVPEDRAFSDYGFIDSTAVSLEQVKGFGTLQDASLDELEEEATSCAKFAFPGEFQRSVVDQT